MADHRMYLVERYWPGVDEPTLVAALPRFDDAARAMAARGTPAEHIGSLLMPADQVVFSLIRATSEDDARELNLLARLPFDRIAAVTAHGFVQLASRSGLRQATP
jgi:hypothetical protein